MTVTPDRFGYSGNRITDTNKATNYKLIRHKTTNQQSTLIE